jgi:hypothetical protein
MEKILLLKKSKFLQIAGIINRAVKLSEVKEHTILKIYNTLTLPILLYGYETREISE